MNRYLPFFVASGVALSCCASFAASPREFLQHALEGDNSEIMLGHLAQDQSRSPAVREFGRTLVLDHSKARDEVLRVGRRFGLRASRDVAFEARDERRRLSNLHDRDFDEEFARYMVEDHHKDISDFREEASAHDGAVSDLAQRQLPTLEKHLGMAMQLSTQDNHRNERQDDRDQRYRR